MILGQQLAKLVNKNLAKDSTGNGVILKSGTYDVNLKNATENDQPSERGIIALIDLSEKIKFSFTAVNGGKYLFLYVFDLSRKPFMKFRLQFQR